MTTSTGVDIDSSPLQNNSLAVRARSGEVLLGTFLTLGAPQTAEICGASGFDWVLIDMEHGAGDWSSALQQMHALAGTPAEPIMRVPSNSRVEVTRALDRGAVGVMIPRVEGSADAEAASAHVRYPPNGDRGVALMNRGAGFGALSPNELRAGRPLLIVQIETLMALDDIAAIAATPGVDVLFVGPSDLTWSLGIPGELDHGRYREAVEAVGRAAVEHSKAAGVLLGNPTMAPWYLELGYTFIGVSADAGLLQTAARTTVSSFRQLTERTKQ